MRLDEAKVVLEENGYSNNIIYQVIPQQIPLITSDMV